jgi:hypothetical protein
MDARAAELLPVPYFHVVFTLPSPIGDIAYQNKAVIYNLLFKASAETMLTIAADPKHLGARIGITAVLHTWGSAMTHHPHMHMIVPGGGISLDGSRWITKRPRFLLPVRVLSKLFRRLMITKLVAAHAAGQLTFHGAHAALVIQPRRACPTQAGRDARRHQHRHLMSPGKLVRRCSADLSRRSSTGRDSARPSQHPKRPRSASDPCCRATRASSPPPRGATITPPATSSAAASSTATSKSP